MKALFPFKGGPRDGTEHYVKDNDCPHVMFPVSPGPIGWDVYVADADHNPTAYEYAGFALTLEHGVEMAHRLRVR